ncbi:hypothetical protein ElyMa_004664900 [Elysia marginata]|uniref:Insulin-like domain-containing protein n=1 Tax=Elysia marginata TaxID=1093978 RepID=A0AAV4I4F6_9GAST|nr:hypothetical protein ElyMa_004664900 [Elysia marginata]
MEHEKNLEQNQISPKTEPDLGQRESLSRLGDEPAENLGYWPDTEFLSEDNKEKANWLSNLLKGRGKRATTEVRSGSALTRRKRDLVCDCCYNHCTFSQVALYC